MALPRYIPHYTVEEYRSHLGGPLPLTDDCHLLRELDDLFDLD